MATETPEPTDPPAPPKEGFPVVGIGASAGGLEALRGFFKRITSDLMAFVVVQHLAPDRESALTELIGRETHIPVHTIQDGMKMERNNVYVAPPGYDIAVLHGVLHLMKPPGAMPRLPIDAFFRSLGRDQGSLAVGVVLSGTGSDGAAGIQAVKAEGGITFVQEPTSARFDGMPRAALETGAADFSLPVEQIADELMGISQHPYLHPREPIASPDGLRKIFILLRAAFGHDFSLYKHATIARRTERRMALHKIERLEDYVTYLQSEPAELAQLSRDLLISVTAFFRDQEPFEALKTAILPAILARRPPPATIRVWSAGCASGEEPYSLAMCLFEVLEGRPGDFKFQVFATDIDEDAVRRARRGMYSQSIEVDVSTERLLRFFSKRDDGSYQIQRRVRDAVVFATQNVTRDPPFSRVDLIACRNLLIYLQPPLQKKVMGIFHYALRPDGYLLLGNSETVGDSPDLFSLVDRKNKIYARKNIPANAVFDLRFHDEPGGASDRGERSAGKGVAMVSVQQLADRKVLERYGPPGVVINENLDVVQYRGHTGRYLEPAPGQPTLNILKLARPELMVELRPAIQQAFEKNEPVTVSRVRLRSGGDARTLSLELMPLQEPESRSRCLIILFRDDAPDAAASEAVVPKTGEERDEFIADLERELVTTKEYLQTTIEELETSNEELKSTVEELQSSNEELQSTNEELETSKEELQSTNEELTTVNDELQNRMNQFRQSNEDVLALEAGLDTALIMVTADLRIRRFTVGASRVFNLVPEDIGRPVGYLKSSLGSGELERIITMVMTRLVTHEQVIQLDDHWFRLTIAPYHSSDRTVGGAILTFSEADAAHGTADLSGRLAHQIEGALSGIQRPVVVLDQRSAAVWANQAFYEAFHVDAANTLGNLIQNLGNGQWAHPKLRGLIKQVLDGGAAFKNFRIEHDFESIGRAVVNVSGARVPGTGNVRLVVVELDRVAAPATDAKPVT